MFLVIDHPNINGHILTKRTLPPRRDDVIYLDTAPYYSIYFPIPNKAKKWISFHRFGSLACQLLMVTL